MNGTAESELNALTHRIIGFAIEIHRELGPGLLESAYEECLAYELGWNGLAFERQEGLPVRYKEAALDCGYRIDLLVDGVLIVEVKSVASLLPIHEAQLLTYLKISQRPLGLLINFNVPVLTHGIQRLAGRNLPRSG